MEPKNSTVPQHLRHSVLTMAHPELVAAAFSAASMAVFARHLGTEVTPAISQRHSCAPGRLLTWEADQRTLPGYGPLRGTLDLAVIRAGFLGAHIGLALQDACCYTGFAERTCPRRGQLKAQYKGYGMRPEQSLVRPRLAAGDMRPIRVLLTQYEELIVASAVDSIAAAIQTALTGSSCVVSKPSGGAITAQRSSSNAVPGGLREAAALGSPPVNLKVNNRIAGNHALQLPSGRMSVEPNDMHSSTRLHTAPAPSLYRIWTVMDMLAISHATVYRMVARGDLELVKLNARASRITAASVERIISRRRGQE